MCTTDVFYAEESVSLGILPAGNYTVNLIGKSYSLSGMFEIPSSAPDSLYQWNIHLVDPYSDQLVADRPLTIYIGSYNNVVIHDTTDASGFARIEYFSEGTDSLLYYLRVFSGTGFRWIYAKKGLPELITHRVSP
jgi:hypothetical protein